MKRLLIFLALKVVEAAGVCCVLLGAALVGYHMTFITGGRSSGLYSSPFHSWAAFGYSLWDFVPTMIFLFGTAGVVFLVISGLYKVIRANWRWAGKFVFLLLLLPGVAGA